MIGLFEQVEPIRFIRLDLFDLIRFVGFLPVGHSEVASREIFQIFTNLSSNDRHWKIYSIVCSLFVSYTLCIAFYSANDLFGLSLIVNKTKRHW